MIRLATCSWREFRQDMGVPVRISLGRPKFPLPGPLHEAAYVPEVTPRGWYLHAPGDEFYEAYEAQLDRYGVDRIQDRLAAIAFQFGAPLVLCCFENIATGSDCHRTRFALFWRAGTGQDVPELGAAP